MATLEEIGNALRKADAAGDTAGARKLATAYRIASDPISTGARNFAKDMPWLQQAAAGYGKAIPDLVQGIGQLTGLTSQSDVDETKRLDAPLMNTGGGITGNIAGNAAALAPTAMIPGAGSLGGAALIGGVAGALQPVGKNESRTANAMLGAGAGAGGQALGRAIGRAVSPVQNALNPEEAQLAAAAAREGIPLSAGQRTGSRPLQITESVMENLPLTSAPQLAQKEAQQRAFTAAVLKKGGMTGDVADAKTMLTQKKALGKTIGDVSNANNVDFTQRNINAEITRILDDAKSHLPPTDAAKLSGTVDQILSQVDQGSMAGTNYQGWREPLRALAKQGDATSNYYGQIRKTLDDAFRGSLKGDDAAVVTDASRKYANTKTIIDAMGGAGTLPAKGQVAPAQLSAALARSIGKENKTLGGGDLNELSRVGQAFVKDQIPNSGTAQRQMIQSLLTTGGGSLVGSAAAAGTGHDPLQGAMLGGAIGAGSAAMPRALQLLMNSKAGQEYLAKGVLPIDPAQRAALAKAIQLGSMGAVPALSQ